MVAENSGPTVGHRIAGDGATVAYLPDQEPALGLGQVPAAPDWVSGFGLAAGAARGGSTAPR